MAVQKIPAKKPDALLAAIIGTGPVNNMTATKKM
jgi:hypothetical protein